MPDDVFAEGLNSQCLEHSGARRRADNVSMIAVEHLAWGERQRRGFKRYSVVDARAPMLGLHLILGFEESGPWFKTFVGRRCWQ